MKSAVEWIAESICGKHADKCEEDCVRAIQADALLHAAKIIRGHNDLTLTPRSIRLCWAKRIEAEAKKLYETKS